MHLIANLRLRKVKQQIVNKNLKIQKCPNSAPSGKSE